MLSGIFTSGLLRSSATRDVGPIIANGSNAVQPEYFDLLSDCNDVPLLIFIHWATILHKMPKPMVKRWAKRVAFQMMEKLHGDWTSTLAWPLRELPTPNSISVTNAQQQPGLSVSLLQPMPVS
ncbi:hypothetical protein DM02DRAFT_628368 [Periconia macrospinosa]|uniref:Uncharacterized protein n=1 Tax=Periconia macrospinosa TaxID=97972 RepID=A0A2V1DRP0_9PLEO|nr:hypothetical protein DM02DRAFT_628368 [Periconia macrospinosa]